MIVSSASASFAPSSTTLTPLFPPLLRGLRCLAFDPGPTYTGWAEVILTEEGKLFLIAGGHRALDLRRREDRAWVRAYGEQVKALGGIAAVETVIGYAYQAKHVQALLETTRVEGRIGDQLYEAGLIPHEIPAGDAARPDYDTPLPKLPKQPKGAPRRQARQHAKELVRGWRGELCRSPSASNAQIAFVVEGIVGGAGVSFRSGEQEHVYDAIGLAVVTIFRHLKRALLLPAAVNAALIAQQECDKQKAASKRAAKMDGEKVAGPPRRLTRAQSARRAAGQFLRT